MDTAKSMRKPSQDRALSSAGSSRKSNPSHNAGVLREIGDRLRRLRVQHGLNLRQASKLADISPSFLGMLERGDTAVAVPRLIALADVYGVSAADLLANVGNSGTEFVRSSDVLHAPTDSDDVRVDYLSSPSWSMQPFLVRLEPGAHLDSLSHSAEEFVHCISGLPTVIVNGTEYAMAPGDTLLLKASQVHSYANATSATAILVGAVRRSPHGRPAHDVSRNQEP